MHINDEILRENEKQKHIEYLKTQSILNPNVIITAGFGIESQSDKDMLEYSSIHNYIIGINRIKKIGIEKHKSTEQIQYMLRQYITNDILESIIKNKNVKYEYKVTSYEIAGMHIGDSRVQINYDHD